MLFLHSIDCFFSGSCLFVFVCFAEAIQFGKPQLFVSALVACAFDVTSMKAMSRLTLSFIWISEETWLPIDDLLKIQLMEPPCSSPSFQPILSFHITLNLAVVFSGLLPFINSYVCLCSCQLPYSSEWKPPEIKTFSFTSEPLSARRMMEYNDYIIMLHTFLKAWINENEWSLFRFFFQVLVKNIASIILRNTSCICPVKCQKFNYWVKAMCNLNFDIFFQIVL